MVKEYGAMRMVLKDTCREKIAYLFLEAVFYRDSFPRVSHRTNDLFRLHDLFNGHADRLSRNIVNAWKPSFTKLLLDALIIELHDEVRYFRIEVCGWIVEGEVAVFADAYKRDIYRMFRNQFSQPFALCFGVG